MDDMRQDSFESLTQREEEILRLITEGLSNRQIADQLYLTLDTVKWYNKQIFQKLGVHSRTQAVAQARLRLLSDDSSQAQKPNLPVQSTTFIGRERELAELRAHLADPNCRILTLSGPGGIGKTRLAIETARQSIEIFPDGTYFVPLASVESPLFVVRAIADALQLKHTNQQEPQEHIANFLRDKKVLLLVDNFEHLLDSAGLLGDLTERTRYLKLLVTSRERLRLKVEWVVDVKGLQVPSPDRLRQTGLDSTQSEAMQLFLQTAQRVLPGFAPDASQQTHIARVCRLVGGMPLGIELAASWLRVLACPEIAREIEHGLDILTTTWRDVPERHRSMQAVLDHSWQLLNGTEQKIFARMTVFSGSFHRQAAAEVVGASLTTLVDLVDKSYLQRVGSDRFAVHELLKQYGNDKLRNSSDQWLQTRLQHCHYYATYLYQRMQSSDARARLEEIQNEFDDIQAAWRCAVEHKQRDEIRALVAGFLSYYGLLSWYRAGANAIEFYRRALACFDPESSDPNERTALAHLYESLGNLYELSRAHDETMNSYERALAYTQPDDHVNQGRLVGKMGDVWVMLNKHQKADEMYTQAEGVLDSSQQRNAAWWFEWTYLQLKRMELYYWGNRLDDLIALESRIRPMMQQHCLPVQRPRYMRALASLALRRDRFFNSSDAITYSGQMLAFSLENGDLSAIADSHFVCGLCLLLSNRLDEAEEHLQIAQTMGEQNGDLTLLARALTYLTVVYRKRGDSQRVRDCADYGLKIAKQAHMPQYTGMARAQYAWLAWRERNIPKVISHAQAAIEDWGGLGTEQTVVPFRWFALFPLMGAALLQEDLATAVDWAQHLLVPPQQRLPDDLTDLLAQAISAWQQGRAELANEVLWRAFQLAQELCYV